jgi:hypothetical protein
MFRQLNLAYVVILAMLSGVVGVAIAAQGAQDRFTLKSPNGIVFSEFRGYDGWQAVAPSATDDGIKAILANPVMINAYRSGSGAGKPFPDGSMIAKIEWAKTPNADSPYDVTVPGALKSVSFIEKDSRRFKDTDGWGYAQFKYDAAAKTFTPTGQGAGFGKTECHTCHTGVKAADFIFTHYAPR